jgi:hypothetical protein
MLDLWDHVVAIFYEISAAQPSLDKENEWIYAELTNEIGTSEEKTSRFLLPHTTQRVELQAAVMESGEVTLDHV